LLFPRKVVDYLTWNIEERINIGRERERERERTKSDYKGPVISD